ncbi:MAG TPA: trigger factor [bacterium]|nr:trigger factor [bacterium]HPN67141.1 trigger factor [bacterium]
MQLKYENKPNSQIYFLVKVDAEKMPEYKIQALRELGEGMSVGGFRKGKAPVSVVENSIGAEKLLIEAMDMAVKSSYYDAVMSAKNEITTIGTPKIELVSKISPDVMKDGFEYSVLVDVYPDIKLPDLQKIKIEQKSLEVTKEDLDQAMNEFLQKRSSLKDADDNHIIVKGDWADVDFVVKVDGKELPDIGSKHFPLVVGSGSMLPGFEEKILGYKKNDTVKFELEVADDFRDKRLASKKVEFEVTVNDIKEIVKPELDDKLIGELKIENVANVKQFTDFLKDNLQKEKETKIEDEVRNEILENIFKEVGFDLPNTLYEREIHMMWHEFEDNLKQKGIDPVDYLQKEKLDKTKIIDGWKEQAEKRAKMTLMIGEMIRKYEIKVDHQEVTDYAKSELEKIKMNLSNMYPNDWKEAYKGYQKQFKTEQYVKYFEEQILVSKLFDYLKNKVVK